MPLYVIIGDETLPVTSHFRAADRYTLRPGAWFVHSKLETSAEIRELLGIRVGGPNGIIVAAGRYTGVTNSDFVEKLRVWEERDE